MNFWSPENPGFASEKNRDHNPKQCCDLEHCTPPVDTVRSKGHLQPLNYQEFDLFRTSSNSTSKEKHARSRGISLDDLNVRKYASTVRRIFYPVWPERGEWRVVLEPGQPWAWACDFDQKTIFISRQKYPEKDLLRTAIIVQMAHARTGIGSADAWLAELKRARSISESIGRDRIERYLTEIIIQAHDSTLDIRLCEGAGRLETFITETAPVAQKSSRSAENSVSTFQDSLQLSAVERQVNQAAHALRRLSLKNRG